MTASSFDPTTGAPQFADGDAPDVAENANEVADFAASVGTRLIGTTAERTDYDYGRVGLRWYDTDEDAEYLHDGSGWVLWNKPWTSYTPSLSNMTGTVAAEYQVVYGTVNVAFRLTATTVGTLPKFTLPVTAADSNVEFPAGSVMLNDSSAGQYWPGIARRAAGSSTEVELYAMLASGTYAQMVNITSSAPFTWASGDIIRANFSYRSA